MQNKKENDPKTKRGTCRDWRSVPTRCLGTRQVKSQYFFDLTRRKYPQYFHWNCTFLTYNLCANQIRKRVRWKRASIPTKKNPGARYGWKGCGTLRIYAECLAVGAEKVLKPLMIRLEYDTTLVSRTSGRSLYPTIYFDLFRLAVTTSDPLLLSQTVK